MRLGIRASQSQVPGKTTYGEDGDASRAVSIGDDRDSPSRETKDDHGEYQDGDLDIKEKDGLGRDALGEETT